MMMILSTVTCNIGKKDAANKISPNCLTLKDGDNIRSEVLSF